MGRSRKPKQEFAGEAISVNPPEADTLAFTEAFIEEPDPLNDVEPGAPVPSRSDTAWSDFVIGQFSEDELYNGNPTVDGLRRVANLLNGDIIESGSTVLFTSEQRVTAQHIIAFNGGAIGDARFADCADVTKDNVDAQFALYMTACACTRAEGRALRKSLGLKHVVAAEELSNKAPLSQSLEGAIQDSQKKAIDLICQRANINGAAFINSGQGKYKGLGDVTSAVASRMLKKLNDYLREQETVPSEIRGYVQGWAVAA